MNRLVKFFALSVFFIMSAIYNLSADELDADQLNLRGEIVQFLKEEGFVPSIDSDGDIKFKKEGRSYYIRVNPKDTSPMFVTISCFFNYEDIITKNRIEKASLELNNYKVAKIVAFDDMYKVYTEMFVRNSEACLSVFYKLIKQMTFLIDYVRSECEKVG